MDGIRADETAYLPDIVGQTGHQRLAVCARVRTEATLTIKVEYLSVHYFPLNSCRDKEINCL